MKSVIRTNKVIPKFDYKRIDEEYDIFCLETSKKYISTGAKIIDAPLLNKDVKAVLFEKGKRFFVLLNHNTGNLSVLKSVLNDTEYGSSMSISQKRSSQIQDFQLLQLLINGLAAKNHAMLKFNNLTGHFYVFKPEWVSQDKNGVIWSIPTIEIKMSEICLLKLNVRTFTTTKLKNKMTFNKKKFEDYPKYILSSDNSMRRKTVDDTDVPTFILRQIDNSKNEITFLDISNRSAFEATKIGILTKVIESFNTHYKGIAEIEFQIIDDFATIDTKSTAKENERSVKAYIADRSIRIIDCVQNEYSLPFCEYIASTIEGKYGKKAKIGSRLSKNALNIRLIHNKDYYNTFQNDPHKDNINGYTVQHITFEDFSHNSKYAISTVIHELIIKNDIRNGVMSLFDWTTLRFDKEIDFGISTGGESPRYFFMNIQPDGTFSFSEQKLNLFEMNEYSACVQIFDDDKQVVGIIKYSDDDILVIRNTEMFTLPEFEALDSELEIGNTALRNKESRDELLTSVTEIRNYRIDNSDYYFVGVSGSGMKPSIQTSAQIRCVSQAKTGTGEFSRLLPLMNVSFVRNGQLTVIPFPFKYLREYLKTLND